MCFADAFFDTKIKIAIAKALDALGFENVHQQPMHQQIKISHLYFSSADNIVFKSLVKSGYWVPNMVTETLTS